MFDIDIEWVMCDGMTMRRDEAIAYMQGRQSSVYPGSHSSWFSKSEKFEY